MENLLRNDLVQRYADISYFEKQRWQELRSNKIQTWVDIWEQSVDINSTAYVL